MINGRYSIVSKLGKGRSQVFLCRDNDFPETDIAIKILPKNAGNEEVRIFRNEFFILRKLNHPNIVRATDFGTITKVDEEEGILCGSKFITMEYFHGEELFYYKKLSDEPSLREIVKQICSVLYYLHLSNYIYYDLKLENILLNETNGRLNIKLIDLGFAQHNYQNNEELIRGTAEYIAPEILRKEKHDHRIDLYSFGIMLYRIVYGKFPFERENELEIYKSHLESEFEFPKSKFSQELIEVIKKLLSKNPEERFHNSLQILGALNFNIDEELAKNWVPARVFSNRKDILTIMSSYFSDETSGEVFTIKGFEGAGKSALLDELYFQYENVILIKNNKSKTGVEFVKIILKEIVFSEFVYQRLSKEILSRIDNVFTAQSNDIIGELKAIITAVSTQNDFKLLLDDFNLYDEFTVELLRSIIPIMQVNKIKLVLTENSDFDYHSNFIFNLREVNLNPFTELHLEEYLAKSFYDEYPVDEVKSLILLHADLLPGSIETFFHDLIFLKIIQYTAAGVIIKTSDTETLVLKNSQDGIYALRFQMLTKEEMAVAKIISCFNIALDETVLSEFFDITPEQILSVISTLQNKNIIQQRNKKEGILYTSEGLKRFVYSKIDDKAKYHLSIAEQLDKKIPSFNRTETARHFELAEYHYNSYQIYMGELEAAERLSAYSYQRNILLHLLELNLEESLVTDTNIRLCKILYKLGDYQKSLKVVNELIKKKLDEEVLQELMILRGSSLIGLGENEEGKNILTSIINRTENETRKQSVLVEIASAEFELNNLESVTQLCKNVVSNSYSRNEDKGKCYNILGLTELFKIKNLTDAFVHISKAKEIYKQLNFEDRIAQMDKNIGIIYYLKGEHDKAELIWNNSLTANIRIGNLEQEGKLLINLGIFYYEKLNYEKASELYKKASIIFVSMGNKFGEGQVQTNIGEVYLASCDYQNALNSLIKSINIFSQLQIPQEELEAQFILAKLYSFIGYFEELPKVIERFNLLNEKGTVVKKNIAQLKYILQLAKVKNDFSKSDLNVLYALQNDFFEQEDILHYFSTTILIVKDLIRINKYDEAIVTLCNERFNEICQKNALILAEREYMLGKLSEMNPDLQIKTSVEYYNSALEILEDFSVTELTWKILYELGNYFYQRGNYSKARENFRYSKEIIYYFGDNINNHQLRDAFFNKPERKEALMKIDKLGI